MAVNGKNNGILREAVAQAQTAGDAATATVGSNIQAKGDHGSDLIGQRLDAAKLLNGIDGAYQETMSGLKDLIGSLSQGFSRGVNRFGDALDGIHQHYISGFDAGENDPLLCQALPTSAEECGDIETYQQVHEGYCRLWTDLCERVGLMSKEDASITSHKNGRLLV